MQKDQFSKSKRSWIMSRIKAKDTKAELKLRKELWRKGLRYRVNYREVLGTPDIYFDTAKVTIFVDGAFWHGKKLSETRLSKMSKYWQEKIHQNIKRDESINNTLEQQGYTVIRIPEHEILINAEKIALEIESIIRTKK